MHEMVVFRTQEELEQHRVDCHGANRVRNQEKKKARRVDIRTLQLQEAQAPRSRGLTFMPTQGVELSWIHNGEEEEVELNRFPERRVAKRSGKGAKGKGKGRPERKAPVSELANAALLEIGRLPPHSVNFERRNEEFATNLES